MSTRRDLVEAAVDIAQHQIGIREVGRNRGPRVEEYLASVGLDAGDPWCAAFVWWVIEQAAERTNVQNPLYRTGGVHRMWRRMVPYHVTVPGSGMIFFHDAGGGFGHTGFVEQIHVGELVTIEGNTDTVGSREGDGVRRKLRPQSYVNLGYLDLTIEPRPLAS